MLVFGAAVLILFLRRPEALTRAEFWADDGAVYQQVLLNAALTLMNPYSGVLIVLQRVVVLVEMVVPAVYAPLIGNLAMILVMAAVAAFLASDRMSRFLPSRRWRLALALLFVVLPAGDRVIGTLSDVQWVLGVYLIAMLVATVPTSARGRFGDALGIIVAGLTGPLSILLVPLYSIRAWRERAWVWQLTWLTVAATIQVVVLLASPRYAAAPMDAGRLPVILLVRGMLVPVGGIYGLGATGSVVVALAVLALLLLALARLPRTWLAAAFAITIAVAVTGIRFSAHPTAQYADPLIGGRYFYLGGVVIAGFTMLALSRRHWLALPLAAVLTIGVAADFRMPPIPSTDWTGQAACIGGPTTCSVPFPGGVVVWEPGMGRR